MRKLLISLLFLSSTTICQAHPEKEFLELVEANEKTANTINRKIEYYLNLNPKDLENKSLSEQRFNYFGQNTIDDNLKKRILELQPIIKKVGASNLSIDFALPKKTDLAETLLSHQSLRYYFSQTQHMLELRDKVSAVVPKSPSETSTTSRDVTIETPPKIFMSSSPWGIIKDMETLFVNFNSRQRYLSDVDQHLFSFFKTECVDKKESKYGTTLYLKHIYLQERRATRNLLNILKRINIESFEFNENYKNQLRATFHIRPAAKVEF